MKQKLFTLILLLMIFLTACQPVNLDSVTFYYFRESDQYQYFEDNGVICTENRDLLGHRSDLQYMAGLYLAGPLEEGMASPFTKSTRLLSIQQVDSEILVELSEHTAVLTDSEFTLSSACLAMTCMDFTPCDAVTVTAGDRSVTLTLENIVLFDSLQQQEINGG